MHKPRPYQIAAAEAVLACWASGNRRAAIAMATGTGKTVVFANVVHQRAAHGRAMVLAHRKELIEQACKKIEEWTGNRPAIEMADQRADAGMYDPERVVVSSIKTQAHTKLKRAKGFDPMTFGTVVLDEGHHLPAKSFTAVVDHYLANPDCKFLTVSATFDRQDEEAIDAKLCFEYSLDQAVNDGYLVPIVAWKYEIDGLDFSRVRSSGGDLSEADLDTIIREEEVLHGVCCAAIEAAYGMPKRTMQTIKTPNELATYLQFRTGKPRSTIIFLPARASKKQKPLTELCADIINRWLPDSARAIDGEMDPELRSSVNAGFKAGSFPFLCGCMVPTEGWDAPIVSCIIMARATKSRGLYAQMAGRATRPSEEIADRLSMLDSADDRIASILASRKINALIVDLVGQTGRHKLVCAAHLFCQPGAGELAAQMPHAEGADARQIAASVDALYAKLERAKAMFQATTIRQQDEWVAKALRGAKRAQEASGRLAGRKGIIGNARMDRTEFDPLADEKRKPGRPEGVLFEPPAKNKKQPNQFGEASTNWRLVAQLENAGVTRSKAIELASNERQAYTVIGQMGRKHCTKNQAFRLRKMGYGDAEIASMNKKTASGAIGAAQGVKA